MTKWLGKPICQTCHEQFDLNKGPEEQERLRKHWEEDPKHMWYWDWEISAEK